MWTYPFLNPLYDFPTELPFCPFITTLNKMRFWKVVSATRYAIMRNGPTKHMQANSNSELRNIQNYNAAKVGLATLSAFVLSKSSFRFFENFCGILWIVQCFFFLFAYIVPGSLLILGMCLLSRWASNQSGLQVDLGRPFLPDRPRLLTITPSQMARIL